MNDRWIRTKDGEWYVHKLRGTVYISWVQKKHREHAEIFPADNIEKWVKLLSDMTGLNLEVVFPDMKYLGP